MAEASEQQQVPAVKTCEACGTEFTKKKGVSVPQWLRSRACSRSCSCALGQANRVRPPLAERFWSKVDKAPGHGPRGDCWLWTGHLIKFGYGSFKVEGSVEKAHRVAFGLMCEPIPEGVNVLHRCDFPPCVRPGHLFLGGHEANMADMVAKGRGDAPKGEAHHDAKLTEEQVRTIRADRRPQRVIASAYGVSQGAIGAIKTGRNWKHLA